MSMDRSCAVASQAASQGGDDRRAIENNWSHPQAHVDPHTNMADGNNFWSFSLQTT